MNSTKPTTAQIVGGTYNAAQQSLTDGQGSTLQLDNEGNLLVNVAIGGGGGGSNPSVGLTGATAPTSATEMGIIDGNGKLQGVSATNPVPISGSISATNPSVGSTGANVPTSATYIGADNPGGKLTGLAVDAGGNLFVTLANLPIQTSDSHFPLDSPLSDAISNPNVTLIGSNLLGWDATNSVWRRIQVDAGTGTLKVDPGTVAVTQSTFPWTSNISQFGGNNVQTGVGAGGSGIPRVTVSNDSQVILWDGSNISRIKAASTAALATDPSLVVALSPNSPLPAGSNIIGSLALNQSINLNQVGGNNFSLGQHTSANSIAVVLASDQNTITTSDSHFPASVALSDALANPTTTEIGANMLGWDATNSVWRRIQVDAGTGTLKVDGSGTTQPVSIAATVNVSVQNATLAVTQSTSPWVDNVSQFGGNPVVTGTGVSGVGIPRVTVSSDSFPATQPISAASLPLPTNAAQETGGNLATISTQTRNSAQDGDLLSMILAQLKLLNYNMASNMTSAHVDLDSSLIDTFPTN